MPKPRPETPPEDWTPVQAVAEPIINDPYTAPQSHYKYKEGIPNKVPGRRPAGYFYKTARTGSGDTGDLFAEQEFDDLPLVNALREDVARWRDSGYRGASAVTRELFAWWRNESVGRRRLFFCQLESAETIIYLLELAIPGRLAASGFKSFSLSPEDVTKMLAGEKPSFKGAREDFFPKLIDESTDNSLTALRRMACKMATGSGKTLVMAMINTWAFCNRARNPASTNFPNGVLVCAPNLPVKMRLQVLMPENPDNFYDAFNLVPPKFRECLNMGKVLITNWHVFSPKSEHDEGGKSYAVVNKGEETNDAFARDRLGELASRLPILVLNDEGHHCWRERPLTPEEQRAAMRELNTEEKENFKEEVDEARVWLAGLDKLNNSGLLGNDASGKANPGILACIDFSATPFYLSGSGHIPGSPFPWVISDFGLIDAIESGIVKIPRLPVKDDLGKRDDAGRPDPQYFRLWDHIKKKLRPEDYIRRGEPKPEAIYLHSEGALKTLASQWKKKFDDIRASTAGGSFIPPVLIVVCDNTSIAQVFYERISGETVVVTTDEDDKETRQTRYGPSDLFPELSNTPDKRYTVRIDTKLLKSIETSKGESKDEAALALRELLDTVGKPGKKGEQIRCVVSVSMLTEGWDAQNVTHVFGVRAFDSQLLCEQVVGRGLRRMSYTPDHENGGKLTPEHVDVYGIPFSLIPFKGVPAKNTPSDPVYHEIYAVPERAPFKLAMPNVESYTYVLQDSGVTCNVDTMGELIVAEEPNAVYLAPTRGYDDGIGPRPDQPDFIKQTREEYYRSVRPQQIQFKLAQLITDDLLAGVEGTKIPKEAVSRHTLFPRVLAIVREYIDKKVTRRPGTDERELGLERYIRVIRERLRTEIQTASAKDKATLLPVINAFRPETSTAQVNYRTARPVVELTKSHLNRASYRSDPERRAIQALERMDCVECFTPNDAHIGLLIHYEHEEHRHTYEPDFIVKLKNGALVILEIKGLKGIIHNPDQVNAKNAAAKRWVTAVNNTGRWGQWSFEFCMEEDIPKLRERLASLAGFKKNKFIFVPPTAKTAWKTCIPMTTLAAAAGGFGDEQMLLEDYARWSEEWINWEGAPKFEEGMFVAQVHGASMEPKIPNGAYCLFRSPRAGSRQGKVVLVWHAGIEDPHTGGAYTVKVYESEKRKSEEADWDHAQITLKPLNPAYEPIVLAPKDEGEVRVVAEFVSVV